MVLSQVLAVASLVIFSWWTLWAHTAVLGDDQVQFPEHCDDRTVALWLFDEQPVPGPVPPEEITRWYYTQTLTDASRNYYDLHRLNGANISAGRFGNALRVLPDEVGTGMNLPANYASEPRVYGVFLPADHEFVPRSAEEAASEVNFFWYTQRPDELFSALVSEAWTIELWVRLSSAPSHGVTLIDGGQGDDLALRIDLLEQGRAARIQSLAAGIDVTCPLPNPLQAQQWYHLAWATREQKDEVLQFLNGKVVSRTSFTRIRPKRELSQQPGLVARPFASGELSRPLGIAAVSKLATAMSELPTGAQSVRLRGWVRAPHTGRVRFSTAKDCGLHLDVDHRPLIYGWFGRARRYKGSPRWGELELVEGQIYPVLIDAPLVEEDSARDGLPLFWSWHGQDVHPIPDSAWLYSDKDVVAAETDEGGLAPETLTTRRFNCVLGSDRWGRQPMDGWIDEARISSVCRYTNDFKPASHSFVQRSGRLQVASQIGPPLLFATAEDSEVVELGARKHLFIDDALIDGLDGLRFEVNPPRNPVAVVPELPTGDHSFFDMDGKVALFASAGYGGREEYADLWRSDDGVHFTRFDRGKDAAGNPLPIDTGVNAWGRMAIDPNPDTPPWARFKFTAGVPHRGIYLLVSPDAVNWRRHESAMLQVGTGGESHWYWDDQAGLYRYLLKWDHGPGGRQAVEAELPTLFAPPELPKSMDDQLGLMTPHGFMPTRFAPNDELGQVYRTRVAKYQGAPDTYLAFLWRFDRATEARQVELAVSRDGQRWKYYGSDWYMPAEFDFQGDRIREVTSVDGLIQRGNEIWQYADYSTGRHNSSAPYWRVRLEQRLDGFVALTAGGQGGSLTTRPIHFAGNKLSLNAAVQDDGSLKVALLDHRGAPIPGFGLADCSSISGDSISHPVTWQGKSDISSLADRAVRVHLQMERARLFALEFK